MIPIFLGLSEKKNYLKDYQLSEGSWSKRRATFYWKVEAPISLCLYLEQVESCTEARSGINQSLFFSRDKFLVFSGVFLTVQTAVSSIWDRVFKNGPGKICGRQPLKFGGIWSADHIHSNFWKAVVHKFYLVHVWILCHICFAL